MKYDLVFEGGGAKGMVFVGAMQEFEEQGHTYERLLGTSAGAITATFLAAEYTTQEMLDALSEQEDGQPIFASFMGPPAAFDDEAVRNSATLALLRNLDFSFIPNFLEKGIDEKLTQALMKGGHEGAEILAAILNRVFDLMVNAVYEYGGFISGFGGDAFTGVFPLNREGMSDNTLVLQVFACAEKIQAILHW